MHFLVMFDLPELDCPQRQFERPTLNDGQLRANQMANLLKEHRKLPSKPVFFLYVWSGSGWVPAHLVIEHRYGYCMPGWRTEVPWIDELPTDLQALGFEGAGCGFFWNN